MSQADAHTYAKAAPELVRQIRSGDTAAFELFYRMEFLNLVHANTSRKVRTSAS